MRTELRLPHLSGLHDLFYFDAKRRKKMKTAHYEKWLMDAQNKVLAQSHQHHSHHLARRANLIMTLQASSNHYTPETIYLLESAVLELLQQLRIIRDWDQVAQHRIKWCADIDGSIVVLEDAA